MSTPPFAEGTWTEVYDSHRGETVAAIVVQQGLPMGPRGPEGPTGPTGPRAGSVWFYGEGDPNLDLELRDKAVPGDFYLDVSPHPNAGNVWTYAFGADGYNIWIFLFAMESVTGPTGPEGVLGATGPTGPTGETGTIGPMPILEVGDVNDVDYGFPPDVGFTAKIDSTTGEHVGYVVNFTLESGPTGPPGAVGTNIIFKGELPTVGPPSPTNPPDGSAATPPPQPGDGWIDSNDDMWVWTDSGWVNVGGIAGVGPTGPMGPGFVCDEYPLQLQVSVDGKTAYQEIQHALQDPYPLVRVLIPDLATGYLMDPQSVTVLYMPNSMVRIETDPMAVKWNPPPVGVGGGKVVVTGGLKGTVNIMREVS